ncbi:Dihydroceramide delta(4)-desaturase [Saitozyma sp. JCM 24511]|nr:Dihydroceramide delta(4)-desaturase [Saitozyma sp. JCM 24511]
MSTSSYFRSRTTRPRGKDHTQAHAHALDRTPLTPSDTDPSYAPSEDSEGTGTGAGAGAEVVGFVDPFPDFLWMTTEEPHRSRRMAILRAHPEVRKLMGPTPLTFPIVLLVLSTQLILAYWLRSTHPLSPLFLLTAYTLGGTLNQNTFLAIHEITHNLAFRSIRANKLLAIVANFAIGVPYAMAFKGYHIEHHKFLGEDGIDTDLPSRIEAIVLNNVAGKTFFATFQLLFYALRPGFIRSQKPTIWHGINFLAVLSFDAVLVHFLGWNALVYLLISSFFAGSLHPCAAHFIAEHYLMSEVQDGTPQALAQETTSYYGWLNLLCYNVYPSLIPQVGYHNEHHDFPSIPWTRLPELRRIASEFYEPLPAHKSWPYVTYKFITDPNVGMWSRAKRTSRGEKLDERVWVDMARGGGGEEISEAESSDVGKGMEEAVQRGYASD